MIVTQLEDLLNTDRDVHGQGDDAGWASRRYLLAEDDVGFTLTETTIEPGEHVLWYKHHLEANYVIDGDGEVEDITTGKVFPLKPGTTYTLNQYDKHRLKAFTRLRLVCVFTPALTGRETHDKDGSYNPPSSQDTDSSEHTTDHA